MEEIELDIEMKHIIERVKMQDARHRDYNNVPRRASPDLARKEAMEEMGRSDNKWIA